ncbi:MAG: hypothetical protein RR939_11750, partial [Acinetobacter sp.]
RKRTFKVIIKLTQDALKINSDKNHWVEIKNIVETIQKLEPHLNIESYNFESLELAIRSISGGWVEFDGSKVKLGKLIS